MHHSDTHHDRLVLCTEFSSLSTHHPYLADQSQVDDQHEVELEASGLLSPKTVTLKKHPKFSNSANLAASSLPGSWQSWNA